MLLRSIVLLVSVFCFVSSALAIDPPNNPRGTETSPGVVKWEWDWPNGASRFDVTVDGNYVGQTTSNSYESRDLWVGDHSMTVRAIDGNWQYSTQSVTARMQVTGSSGSTSSNNDNNGSNNGTSSNPVSSGASGGQVRGQVTGAGTIQWEWDWPSNAVRFDVIVDYINVGQLTTNNYLSENLGEGDHSIIVKAIDANWNYFWESELVTVNLSNSSNGGTTSTPANPQNDDPNPIGSRTNPEPADNDRGKIDPSSWSYPEVYQKPGYELSFSDEFDNSVLSQERWNTQLRWDGEFNGERYEYRVINGEDQFYVNIYSNDQAHKDRMLAHHNPFELDGNRLAIRAIKNPIKTSNGNLSYGNLQDISSQQTFLSGALTTYDKFTQKYGIFEARIKIPSHVGTFPAFWLHHQRRSYENTQRTEIDIMENLGHAPWYIYNSFHYNTEVRAFEFGNHHFLTPSPSGQIFNGTDFSQDYHTYAVEWEPGRVRWFIDGQQVSELNNSNVDYEELYILINLAIGGDWTNFPTNSGGLGRAPNNHFPTQEDLNNFSNPALEIDYVRVYRRN